MENTSEQPISVSIATVPDVVMVLEVGAIQIVFSDITKEQVKTIMEEQFGKKIEI